MRCMKKIEVVLVVGMLTGLAPLIVFPASSVAVERPDQEYHQANISWS